MLSRTCRRPRTMLAASSLSWAAGVSCSRLRHQSWLFAMAEESTGSRSTRLHVGNQPCVFVCRAEACHSLPGQKPLADPGTREFGIWRPVSSRPREFVVDCQRPRQNFCVPGQGASSGDRPLAEAVLRRIRLRTSTRVLQSDAPPNSGAIGARLPCPSPT